MRRTMLLMGAVVFLAVAVRGAQAQRGGRAGGATHRPAVGPRPAPAALHTATRTTGAAIGPYGGAGVGTRTTNTVTGPAGGTRTAGTGSGSFTTQRGTTVNVAGAGARGTTAGGVNYGRGVGGVQVTTPGGQTATHISRAGGVAGPGGNAVAGRSGATFGSGPGGAFGTAHRGGVAVGPQGAVAGGSRAGVAVGPGGVAAGAARGGVAAGPYGAVAGGTRVGAVAGPGGAVAGVTRGGAIVGPSGAVAGVSRVGVARGTVYTPPVALRTTGVAVRTNFAFYPAFTPAWYARYPGAWFAAGWTAARIWSAPAWGTVAAYGGFPATPVFFDYGETVVYSGNTVIINGETEVPADAYAQQATDLAAAGKAAKVEPAGNDFQPLGVFAMVGEGETRATNIFQLAISTGGVIRGNYYNALTDTTEPVFGSVDKATQRAAWTVGDRKAPVYEAGIANLTRDETTMLAHFSSDNSQQFTLVRVQQPDGDAPPPDGGK